MHLFPPEKGLKPLFVRHFFLSSPSDPHIPLHKPRDSHNVPSPLSPAVLPPPLEGIGLDPA